MQPRVRGLDGTIDELRDLRHRQLVELVEHEDDALVLVELVEQAVEHDTRCTPLEGIELRWRGRLVRRWLRNRPAPTQSAARASDLGPA